MLIMVKRKIQWLMKCILMDNWITFINMTIYRKIKVVKRYVIAGP